jgi:hypothetical protein
MLLKCFFLFVIAIKTVKARNLGENSDDIHHNADLMAGSPEEGYKHDALTSETDLESKVNYGGSENEGREERIVNRNGNIRERLYSPERARPMSQFSDTYLFNTRVPSHRYTGTVSGTPTYSDASHENDNMPSISRVIAWIFNWLFTK